MSEMLPSATHDPRVWRGIHHIALATADLDATVRFYRDVLGMQISNIYRSEAGRGRHALIMVKLDDSEVWGLHFFERVAGVSSQSTTTASVNGTSQLLHIALRLANRAAAQALRERLSINEVGIGDRRTWQLSLFR
jgi:catechol 2,3-dioxygenase-like lactoylglutathione lyase family enzyme